ncbi:GNAT family N-acetyltransferase [Clostridium guangxiense]|uniref:GNAT family N-acetyltransferase n=1 Tax=Clostridium guangxiense TaxID=1662055 RepID=UPI001E5DF16C|nr:GNAT family N-acetyltransferase [Clostridium guangxiense]MCD2346703.1 GNAT family N-acetyltransferase [Clostridium guangxiense]
MEYIILETNSDNADFSYLTNLLDNDLSLRYGEMQKKYDTYNKVNFINDVVIIYKDSIPVACGAIKEYSSASVELKRIFVKKEYRGNGLAKLLIHRLEEISKKRNYKYLILQTGSKQLEAVSLYKKLNYKITDNYPPYIGDSNSICMEKSL